MFTPLAVAAAVAVAPSCTQPSHDRLIVQPGRDVCAAALTPDGRPRAAGFLPTSCARPTDSYAVDAQGRRDLCRPADKPAPESAR